jgi:quaternary ammonium compound-resistance protein SugE
MTLSNTAAWLVLLAAGLLEVVWSVSMKASEGFSRPLLTGVTIAAAGFSCWLLGMSLNVLPGGNAYAVWTGIGAIGAALLGIVIFKEPTTVARIGCILLIVAGILGLKVTSGH